MPSPFNVDVRGFSVLEEIEGSWSSEDFEQLLDRMEFGDSADLSPDDLREMCVLSLRDMEPAKAASILLQYRLGDSLSKGQIQNVSHEMLDEKLWEEYADMPLHERFFHVGGLLYQAFPSVVPVPDAVEVRLAVTAKDHEGARLLEAPLHETLIVRLLADGMPDDAPLNRLFGEAVRGKPFPEAESIVWIVNSEPLEAGGVGLQVIGSGYWFDALRETKSFTSAARPDVLRKH